MLSFSQTMQWVYIYFEKAPFIIIIIIYTKIPC